MSTPVADDEDRRDRYVLYALAAGLLVVLLVIMLLTYRGQKESEDALAKADELNSALQAAGLPTRDPERIARVLGDDGGAVCDDPGDLSRALLKMSLVNGAAGPGIRPVIADTIVVEGERVVLETYCPDELTDFDDFVDSLKLDDVSHS